MHPTPLNKIVMNYHLWIINYGSCILIQQLLYGISYTSNQAKSWNKKLIFWKIKMAFLGNRPQIWSIMTRNWGSDILTTYRLRLYTRYYQEVHQVACTIMSRLHYYKFLLALISHGQVQNLPIWVHPKLT